MNAWAYPRLMQRVIHLIESLREAGIEVPPYPYVEPTSVTPAGPPVPSEYDLQARVDAFEARVVAWRQEVNALHKLHFPHPPGST